MKSSFRIVPWVVGIVAAASASVAAASPYAQTNLVSDIPGVAQLTDAALRNPWGVSFSATSPFWVSNQGTNTSTLYRFTNGTTTPVALVVATPTTGSGPQGPTGQVSNNTGAFAVGAAPASFIFANINGTISAWNGAAGTTAQVKASTAGAVYTGLAITNGVGGPRLYAANSAGGTIDVFDGAFNRLTVAGGFANPDPRLAGLVPFNVTTVGSTVYVTYAPPGRGAQIAATSGQGAVAVFDTNGNLIRTLIAGAGDHLAAPWGVALAPSNFGGFSNALLVGNFSFALSQINAFDPLTGAFLGTVGDNAGRALIASPFANTGLWAIEFGNGVSAPSNALLFAAGINGEANGLIGVITAVPEPASVALVGVGLVALLAASRRRRR